jgi:hypothetical protein
VRLPSTAHSREQNDRPDREHENVQSESKRLRTTSGKSSHAAGTVGSDFAITPPRLAHRYKAGTGHNFALRKIADNTCPTVLGLEIGMLGEVIRDLSLRLEPHGACALPADFSGLIEKRQKFTIPDHRETAFSFVLIL